MNNIMQEAHAMSTGLISILTDFEPATEQLLNNDEILKSLYDLEHGLGEPLNLSHKLLYLNEDISIDGEFQPTTGTIGLVLTDNQSQPVTIASIKPNINKAPLILDTSQPCAFVVGDLKSEGDTWAVTSLEDGIKLYLSLT